MVASKHLARKHCIQKHMAMFGFLSNTIMIDRVGATRVWVSKPPHIYAIHAVLSKRGLMTRHTMSEMMPYFNTVACHTILLHHFILEHNVSCYITIALWISGCEQGIKADDA